MKHRLFSLSLVLAACFLGSGLSQVITPPATSPAEEIARRVANELNDEFARRIHLHRRLFTQVWRSADATPDQILAALGNQGARLFQLSAENVEHIDRLATILGKDVADFIPDADRVPPRAVTLNPDGTVTLGP